MRSSAVLCGALAALSVGCPPSAEKREAQRIVAAIERVRMAEPDVRGPVLEALEKEKAESPHAENARASCAQAYRAMHDARRAMESIEQRMASEKGEIMLRLMADLEAAQKQVEKAHELMPSCTEALRELKDRLR